MKTNFLIILLSISCFTFGQQAKIDSLKLVLNYETKKEKKLQIITSLNKQLISFATPNEALPFFEQMVVLAKEIKDVNSECLGYRYISESYRKLENYNEAEHYASISLRINDSIDNTEQYLLDINLLGRVYHHFQMYTEAIATYKKGIKKYYSNPVGNSIGLIYSNLGTAYGQIGEKEQQIKTLIKASNLADSLSNYNAKVHALYSLAWIYDELSQFEKSEKYYLAALKDTANVSNAYKTMLYHGLAGTYSHSGKYQKALVYNKMALENYRKSGNKLYEFDVLNNTSAVYIHLNKPKLALKYGFEALSIAKNINHKLAITGAKSSIANAYIQDNDYINAEVFSQEIANDIIHNDIMGIDGKIDLYENFSLIYEKKREFKMALDYHKKLKKLNDSVLEEKRVSKVADIETKYQTEKKENENLQLKANNAENELKLVNQTKRSWYLGIGLLSALLILSVFGYFYNKTNKQKRLIENLQKELHHRVKNNLAIIDTFIEVTKEEFPETAFSNKLNELQNRIGSINEIHQQLYQSQDVTRLRLKKYVETIANNVQNSFDNKEVSIQQNIEYSISLQADKSFPIGIIINEFLTNSFKYAFPDAQTGVIHINFTEENKHFQLDLSDNGIGLPNDFDIEKISSFGLRIMNLLTTQLKGTFNLDSSNGIHLRIRFPR